MWISTQAFHVPKQGSSESEYEDAFYPEQSLRSELTSYRCAVADGATESAFSREWAKLLVRNFGRHRFHLRKQQRLWRRIVGRGTLPWYLASKVTRGAHAAFIGLSIHDPAASKPRDEPKRRTWRAFAVGDSCLFHVRGEKLLKVGPVAKSEAFGNNPYLLSTTSSSSISRNDPSVSVFSGIWKSNDIFYLATDAMAQWLLAEQESCRPPWAALRTLGPSIFEPIVSKLREEGRLHNDDTTLLRVEMT